MSVKASRNAKIEITSSAGPGLDRGLNDARKKFRAFERDVKKSIGAIGAGAKTFGSGALAGLGVGFSGGLVSGLADMGGEALSLDKALTRLQITGEMSTTEVAAFRAEVLRASAATGLAATQVAAGGAGYIAFTGNAKNAQASLELFAEVAQATGAQIADVASIGAVLDKNMNIPVGQWREAFDILIKQGHLGGVEIADLAKSFAPVSAAYATMFSGGSSTKGLAEVSAMAQVVQNMTHDADTTSTYLKDAFSDFGKNASKLRAYGLEPYKIDKTGKATKQLKDGLEMLDALGKTKLARDPELLQKVFPEIRGRSAVQYLLRNLELVHQIANASVNSNQLAKDFAIQHESASGKMEAAWNNIKLAVAEALTPDRIERFAEGMKQVSEFAVEGVKAIAEMAGWIDDIIGKSPTDKAIDIAKGMKGKTNEERQAKVDSLNKEIAGAPTGAIGGPMGGLVDQVLVGAQKQAVALIGAMIKGQLPGQEGIRERVALPWNRGGGQPTTVVKVGADSIVKAHGNATMQRTRPQGR